MADRRHPADCVARGPPHDVGVGAPDGLAPSALPDAASSAWLAPDTSTRIGSSAGQEDERLDDLPHGHAAGRRGFGRRAGALREHHHLAVTPRRLEGALDASRRRLHHFPDALGPGPASRGRSAAVAQVHR